MTRRWPTCLACGLALVLLAGCSSKPSISGKVNFDNTPVDEGSITFLPEGGQRAEGARATAEIKDGKYEIPSEKGPPPGKYRVEIFWKKKTGKQIQNPTDPGTMIDESKQVIPEKYNVKSELTAEVKSGANTFDFDLKAGGPVPSSSGIPEPPKSKAAGD